jgi:hypothetical protein
MVEASEDGRLVGASEDDTVVEEGVVEVVGVEEGGVGEGGVEEGVAGGVEVVGDGDVAGAAGTGTGEVSKAGDISRDRT